MTLVERFLKYVSFPTTSGEDREGKCSTDGQYVLAEELKKELSELGLTDISSNEYGIVYSTLKGEGNLTIALLAHMDTSPSASGENIKPRIIENYDGTDIELSQNIYLKPQEFETLKDKKGHKLIVTDGKTLLGGDDKAGIAIIMTVLDELIKENKKHVNIEVIFTTDEEIGTGVHHVEMDKIHAAYGYTVDGGSSKYINKSKFNAINMEVTIKGRSVHPGSAKNKMINANTYAMIYDHSLPQFERPEYTEKREGFFHLCEMKGSEEEVHLSYILRDFSKSDLDHRCYIAKKTAEEINHSLGYEAVEVTLIPCYNNMEDILEKNPQVIKRITDAYKSLNLDYEFEDIRGGTDGAQLSFRGLPCPNLGTGDYNCHGRFEYVDVNEMETMVKVLKQMLIK